MLARGKHEIYERCGKSDYDDVMRSRYLRQHHKYTKQSQRSAEQACVCVGVFSYCEANHILLEHGAGSNCNLKTYQDL